MSINLSQKISWLKLVAIDWEEHTLYILTRRSELPTQSTGTRSLG